MIVSRLSLNTNMLDLGAMLGTQGSVELIRQINRNAGSGSFFGGATDPFREDFLAFQNTIVEPIRAAGQMVVDVVGDIINPDKYRSITSEAELAKGIPPCMQLGVVYFEPVRSGIDDGVLDGFGIDPTKMVDGDPFENICKSGDSGWLASKDLNDKGEFSLTYTYDSTDPELTPEQAMCLTETRDYLRDFMEDENTKFIDPTDYPNLRG